MDKKEPNLNKLQDKIQEDARIIDETVGFINFESLRLVARLNDLMKKVENFSEEEVTEETFDLIDKTKAQLDAMDRKGKYENKLIQALQEKQLNLQKQKNTEFRKNISNKLRKLRKI